MKKKMILHPNKSSRLAVLLGLLALSAAPLAKAATSSAGSGEIAIYTEATGTDIIVENGSTAADFLTHDFDTNDREDSGSFTRSGADISLNRSGHYLAIYNSQFNGAPQAGSEERVEVQTYLTVAGAAQASGWSQGFIRRQSNQLDTVTAGMAIIEANASDVVQLRSFRTDTTTIGSVTRVASATGLQLVKLDDVNMAYARLSLAANQAGPTNATAVQVLYDTTDELDAGFSYTNGTGDLTLADAGKYLVIANSYIDAPNNRIGFVQQLTLDGAPISGTRTTIYLRGLQSTEEGAAGIGTIIETAAASQILRVTGELDGGTLAGSTYIAGRCGLTVVKLPDAASGTAAVDPDFIRLTHNADQDVNTASDTDLIFDTQDEIDAEFTHTVSTSGINVTTGGDYLFVGSFYGADDGVARGLSNPGWSINDSARLIIGQSGRYTRNTGPPEFGNTLGLVASTLSPGDKVEMISRALASGGTNNANPVAVQGVRLASLFTTAASFEVIIDPLLVAVTEGGATATYDMSLGLAPASGTVEITVTSDADTEVSLDGITYTPTVTTLPYATGGAPQTIHVRAVDDVDVESDHVATISHAITATGDPTNYPTSMPISDVTVNVTDNDVVAINAIDDTSTTNASEDGVSTEALLAPQANLLANDTDGINNVVSTADSVSAEGASVNVLADGTFTYDPSSSPSIQALASGGSLVDTFDYTAMDGEGNTDTATVSITVDGANDAPEAINDRLFDGPLEDASSYISTADLTANDGAYRTVSTDFMFPPGSDLRLLPGKIVTQTPSVGTPPGNGFPENAFDGNIGTFTHTQSNNNSVDHSWQVDLGQVVSLENVTLANRNDCCGQRLRDITVRVLDGSGTEIFNSGPLNIGNALGFTGGATETLFVDFAGPIMGQTLIVDRETDLGDADAGNGSLVSLSEVTLIGSVVGTQTLTDDNLLLNYDASQTADAGRWENLGSNAGAAMDWMLTDVTLDPAPSTTRAQISAAYEWDNILDRAILGPAGGDSVHDLMPGDPDNKDATFEFWVKPANATSVMTLFETGGGTGFGAIINNGVLEAATELDGGSMSGSYVSYDLLADALGLVGNDPTTDFNQYVVGITVGGGLALYVNGVKVDETTSGSGGDWDGGDGSGLGRFGAANHGGFINGAAGGIYDAPFLGQMAIVRLYSGALTPAQVFQNFKAVNADTDIEGDTITATGVIDGTGSLVAIGTQATLASGALVTMTNATGGFDYDPNGAFNVPLGATTTDTFAYQVSDGNGATGTGNVTLTITGVPNIQENWRFVYYNDHTNSGPGEDSAMATNGLTNLQSFAFDLDPTAPAGTLDVDTVGGSITTLGPPNIWSDPVTGRIYLRHTRRADFASIPLTITDQFSRNPGLTFEDSAVAPTVIATGTGDSGAAIEAVQTEFPLILPVSGGKGRYGRVDVTTP